MAIKDVLSFTNSILIPHLDAIKLEEIRNKLVNRRIKKTTKKQDIDIEVFSLKQSKTEDSKQNVLVS